MVSNAFENWKIYKCLQLANIFFETRLSLLADRVQNQTKRFIIVHISKNYIKDSSNTVPKYCSYREELAIIPLQGTRMACDVCSNTTLHLSLLISILTPSYRSLPVDTALFVVSARSLQWLTFDYGFLITLRMCWTQMLCLRVKFMRYILLEII